MKNLSDKREEEGGVQGGKRSHSFGSAYIRGCNSKVLLCVFVILALINILENCFDIPRLSMWRVGIHEERRGYPSCLLVLMRRSLLSNYHRQLSLSPSKGPRNTPAHRQCYLSEGAHTHMHPHTLILLRCILFNFYFNREPQKMYNCIALDTVSHQLLPCTSLMSA